MIDLFFIIFIFVAYLVGSIPFEKIGPPAPLKKFQGTAWFVFLHSMKGFAVAVGSSRFVTEPLRKSLGAVYGGSGPWTSEDYLLLAWTAVFFALLGHTYSLFRRFEARNPISVAFGAFLVLTPLGALTGILSFSFCFWAGRSSGISTLLGLLTGSLIHLALTPISSYLWSAAFAVFLVLSRYEHVMDGLIADET